MPTPEDASEALTRSMPTRQPPGGTPRKNRAMPAGMGSLHQKFIQNPHFAITR